MVERVTQPTLDVVRTLLDAHREGRPIHGWEIMKTTGRSGPTVYKVLDRLKGDKWISGEFEILGPDEARPRRRYYRLTSSGVDQAEVLLATKLNESEPPNGRDVSRPPKEKMR